MDTLTQAEIVAAYEAKVITAERAMALLTGAKIVQRVRQVQLGAEAQTVTQRVKKTRTYQPTYNSRKKWSTAEIEQLKSLRAVETPYKHCAKIFKRSTAACARIYGRAVLGQRDNRRNNSGRLL